MGGGTFVNSGVVSEGSNLNISWMTASERTAVAVQGPRHLLS